MDKDWHALAEMNPGKCLKTSEAVEVVVVVAVGTWVEKRKAPVELNMAETLLVYYQLSLVVANQQLAKTSSGLLMMVVLAVGRYFHSSLS